LRGPMLVCQQRSSYGSGTVGGGLAWETHTVQIPRRVRIAFREELVGWYLRAIDDLFQAEGFRPGPDNPAVSGERRSRVEQYYSAVDWDSLDETSRVLRVFEEVLAGTAN